jgi:hypothetical protein
MGWSTGPVSDPAGCWVLDNVEDSDGHAGFVYCKGWDGVLIACGGDAPITVGVYADDDQLAAGDWLAMREWSDVSEASVSAAVGFVRDWLTGSGSVGPCLSCGATRTEWSTTSGGRIGTRVGPVQRIAGVFMCSGCYFSGKGFSDLYRPVIDLCEAEGVALRVWQVGGGCQAFGVAFPDSDDDDDVREILFGLLQGDPDGDELGVDLYTHFDYDEHRSDVLRAVWPVPDDRSSEAVAAWIVSVVRAVRVEESDR